MASVLSNCRRLIHHQLKGWTAVGNCSLLAYPSLQLEFLKISRQPSSNMASFREKFKTAKRVVALTGAGISAESGVPTFQGSGRLWRIYDAQDLTTPHAFAADPSLVWEFYSYRRELVLTKSPNPAHEALAAAEKRLSEEGRKLTVITLNIDELHQRAGSENVIELHGSLFQTQCTRCGEVQPNHDSPICPALAGKGSPDPKMIHSKIPEADLPRCHKCTGLLRPHEVWLGEALDHKVLEKAEQELDECDLFLEIGTSSVIYPAATFAPKVALRGVPVAEFNIKKTPAIHQTEYYFEGPSGTTLPQALT